MPAPSEPPAPQAPAERWDGHACAYQDLMLELARIGTNIAVRLDALAADLPILEQAAQFCEVSRSVRLSALLAHQVSQPLPAKAAPKPPTPSAAGKPERRDTNGSDPERSDTEAREVEAAERLEDPMREHNLNRPLPELIKEIKRGLDAGALPGTNLQHKTEEAIELAIRMAAAQEAPPLLNRAARRALAHRPRARPSG